MLYTRYLGIIFPYSLLITSNSRAQGFLGKNAYMVSVRNNGESDGKEASPKRKLG